MNLHQLLAERPNLVRIAENMLWLFFDRIFRSAVQLVLTVWIARQLGPEQFGLMSYAIALSGLFVAVATLGLRDVVVRDLVRAPDDVSVTLGTAFTLHLVSGALAFATLLGAAFYLRPDEELARACVIILGSALALKATDIAEYWFESQVKSRYTVIVQNAVFVVFAGVKVVLLIEGAGVVALVWALLLETVVSGITLLVVMGFRGPPLRSLRFASSRAARMLKDSWPLALSGVAVIIYMRIDQVMLGQMIDDAAVGIYSSASRISEVFYFIPMAVAASVFPAISRSREQDATEYRTRFQHLFDFLTMTGLFVAVPLTLFADPLVLMIFGEDYQDAGSVLTVHIWALLFVSFGVVSSKWLILEGLQRISLQRASLGAVLNVTFNFLLIPIYGPLGAAIGTIGSNLVTTLLYDLVQPATRPIFMMKVRSLNPVAAFFRLRSTWATG